MRVESKAPRVAHPPRPTPLLTSRRHIDLQRVCSSISRPR
ncbi:MULTISPECIES: putative leader peptide [unclassified Streptomyces]|nr:putative leader peptide [Streptomyces sp. ME02-8801-2C]